jgi:hypothetical protein
MIQARKEYAIQTREGWAHEGLSSTSVFIRMHSRNHVHTRNSTLVWTRVREDEDYLWLF